VIGSYVNRYHTFTAVYRRSSFSLPQIFGKAIFRLSFQNVFYLHQSYPHSYTLWEIWRPLSDERYKPVKERGGKGRAEKQKSSERGRMESRTGKEHYSGAVGITYRVFYRNDNEFYA